MDHTSVYLYSMHPIINIEIKIPLLVLENFFKNLAVALASCGHSFMQSPIVIRLVISLMFQNEYCFNEHHQVF